MGARAWEGQAGHAQNLASEKGRCAFGGYVCESPVIDRPQGLFAGIERKCLICLQLNHIAHKCEGPGNLTEMVWCTSRLEVPEGESKIAIYFKKAAGVCSSGSSVRVSGRTCRNREREIRLTSKLGRRGSIQRK